MKSTFGIIVMGITGFLLGYKNFPYYPIIFFSSWGLCEIIQILEELKHEAKKE